MDARLDEGRASPRNAAAPGARRARGRRPGNEDRVRRPRDARSDRLLGLRDGSCHRLRRSAPRFRAAARRRPLGRSTRDGCGRSARSQCETHSRATRWIPLEVGRCDLRYVDDDAVARDLELARSLALAEGMAAMRRSRDGTNGPSPDVAGLGGVLDVAVRWDTSRRPRSGAATLRRPCAADGSRASARGRRRVRRPATDARILIGRGVAGGSARSRAATVESRGEGPLGDVPARPRPVPWLPLSARDGRRAELAILSGLVTRHESVSWIAGHASVASRTASRSSCASLGSTQRPGRGQESSSETAAGTESRRT